MAGTLSFYNGMMPGITKMVESMAGDAAAQRGYRQAALAEAAIANARRDNVEAQIKAREYEDVDKNAMGYAIGQHGVTAPELQAFMRQRSGKLNPGEAPREYSAAELERFNPAVRDYAAFRTGKFHDVSQGATGFAQLPAVQNSVRAAADYGKTPGVSAADIVRMNQAAMGKNVLSAEESVPTDVKTWQWLQTQPPEVRAAFDNREKALRAAGASPGATVMTPVPMLGPDGKTTVYGYPSKQGGDIKPTTAVVPPKGNAIDQLVNDAAAAAAKRRAANGGGSAPVGSTPAPAQKLVGKTKSGKNVYEINGQRFVEE